MVPRPRPSLCPEYILNPSLLYFWISSARPLRSRSPSDLSACSRHQQCLDLRIQILSNFQSFGASVRGEKARHPVVGKVHSTNSDRPVVSWAIFSSSAYLFAAVTSFLNAFTSGCPTVFPNAATTPGNALEEVTLNRCTLISFVAVPINRFLLMRESTIRYLLFCSISIHSRV
jgi:hypothetical protein